MLKQNYSTRIRDGTAKIQYSAASSLILQTMSHFHLNKLNDFYLRKHWKDRSAQPKKQGGALCYGIDFCRVFIIEKHKNFSNTDSVYTLSVYEPNFYAYLTPKHNPRVDTKSPSGDYNG